MSAETRSRTAWLTIVGIGEDGVAGLGDEAKRRIAEAGFVFGGRRHLALAGTLAKGELRPWPMPFDIEMRDVMALAGKPVGLCSSSEGKFAGIRCINHLRAVLVRCQMEVITPECSVPEADRAFAGLKAAMEAVSRIID